MHTQDKKTKKKIFYVITKSNWGGAQKYVFDLISSLPTKNFDCILVHGGNGELVEKVKDLGIKTIQIQDLERDVSIIKEFRVLFFLIKIFLKEKPDIVHLNSSKIGGLGSFAGRMAGVKNIIFTAHGWAFNEDRRTIYISIIKLITRFTVFLSHHIITLSDFERSQVSTWSRNKITRIYLGIKNPTFKERSQAKSILIQKNPILAPLKDKEWIGTIGELHKNKGYSYALEAIKNNIDDIVYIIIGEGEELNNIKNLIKKYSLQKKVFLLGAIPNAGELVKAFDIFLLSSVKEGLPYVLLEARAARVPIISTNVGGIPEITKSIPSLTVKPKDPIALSKSIKVLINEENNNWPENDTAFSFETMLEQTIELYSKD